MSRLVVPEQCFTDGIRVSSLVGSHTIYLLHVAMEAQAVLSGLLRTSLESQGFAQVVDVFVFTQYGVSTDDLGPCTQTT